MKKVIMCVLSVVLCTSWIGAQWKREGATGKSNSSPVVNEVSTQAQLLETAKSEWINYLAAFRSALSKRDRRTLYRMTSNKFRANCGGKRRAFFATNEQIEHCLDILTPGRSKYHTEYEVEPAQYDDYSKVIRCSTTMACWSLNFEYHKETGWLLTYYGQPCDGC